MGKYTADWEKRKPKKLKRPLAPFANFVSNFYAFDKQQSKGEGKLFQNASSIWRTMNETEKEYYNDYKERAHYKLYKRTLAAMRKPPPSYGLFTKTYWQNRKPINNGTPGRFREIQLNISAEWRRLSEDEQGIYKSSSKLLHAIFETEQMTVLSGGRGFNENWQSEGVEKVCKILQKKLPATDDAEEEDDSMDEEASAEEMEQDNVQNNDYDDFDDEKFEEDEIYN